MTIKPGIRVRCPDGEVGRVDAQDDYELEGTNYWFVRDDAGDIIGGYHADDLTVVDDTMPGGWPPKGGR